jgi:phosphoribosyl-ATP pyrophosphohydrolase
VSKSFEALWAELAEKAAARPAGSRTVAELDAGVHAIGTKLVEEAAESWMAAEYQSRDEAAEELSQVLYHVQVMLLALGLDLDDVYRYLEAAGPSRGRRGRPVAGSWPWIPPSVGGPPLSPPPVYSWPPGLSPRPPPRPTP